MHNFMHNTMKQTMFNSISKVIFRKPEKGNTTALM